MSGAKPRGRETIRDMILSMAVVAVFVAFIFLVTQRPKPEAVKEIDASGEISVAQSSGAFPVAAPVGLGDGWRTTAARYRPDEQDPRRATWFLGYNDPDGNYVALAQTNYPGDVAQMDLARPTRETVQLASWLRQQTAEGVRGDSVALDGQQWSTFAGAADTANQNSIARTEAGVTTVVTGTVGVEQLGEFASRLESR